MVSHRLPQNNLLHMLREPLRSLRLSVERGKQSAFYEHRTTPSVATSQRTLRPICVSALKNPNSKTQKNRPPCGERFSNL